LEYKKDIEAKSSTIEVILISIKLFLRWLSDEGKYANVAEHIKAPKQDKGYKKDYLTTGHIQQILLNKIDLNTVDGKRNYH
jgi:site-specific recombinase XerD